MYKTICVSFFIAIFSVLVSCTTTPAIFPASTLVPTAKNTFTSEPSPTGTYTYTPIPTNTPTASPSPTNTLTPTPVVYDGIWSGTYSGGQLMAFTVINNQINSLDHNLVFSIGNCRVTLIHYDFTDIKEPSTLSIVSNSFSVVIAQQKWSMMFNGTFTSATTASGNYERINKAGAGCDFQINYTWTATRQP